MTTFQYVVGVYLPVQLSGLCEKGWSVTHRFHVRRCVTSMGKHRGIVQIGLPNPKWVRKYACITGVALSMSSLVEGGLLKICGHFNTFQREIKWCFVFSNDTWKELTCSFRFSELRSLKH